MLSVLPSTNQTRIAANHVCCRLREVVAKGREWFFFLHQYLYMLRLFLVAAIDVTLAY